MLHPKVRELGIETGPRLFARWTDGQLDETTARPRSGTALKTNRCRFRRGTRPARNWRPAALSGGSAMRCGQRKQGSGVQVRETGGWLAAGIGVGWFFFGDSYVLSVLLGSGSENATLREKNPPSGDIDRSIVHACRYPLKTSSEKLLPWSWEEEMVSRTVWIFQGRIHMRRVGIASTPGRRAPSPETPHHPPPRPGAPCSSAKREGVLSLECGETGDFGI